MTSETRTCDTCSETRETRFFRLSCTTCRTCQDKKGLKKKTLEEQAEERKAERHLALQKKAIRAEAQRRANQQIDALPVKKALERKRMTEREARAATEEEQELARRALAKRRLIHFIDRFVPGYKAGWVHQDICRRLEKFSADVTAGLSPHLMLLMPPRHGKACEVGTQVPTPQGLRAIESLRPGDFVFGRDGAPTRVVAVSEIWRDRQLFAVTADDGASVRVDAEHEWVVRLCRKRPVYKAKATAELAGRKSPRAPALQTYEAARYPEADLPVAPYVLGAWLGDGAPQHATITTSDADFVWMRAEIEREGVKTLDRGAQNTFAMNGLQALLPIGNKHIPEAYQCASVEQRKALLQGLIDTDGHVATDGQVEFCSANRQLAEGVLRLVRSLGVKASLLDGRAVLDGLDCGAKYRVLFYMAEAARMPRKAVRCRNAERTPHRFISFQEAGRGDTVCIQVEAEDQQYLVGEGYLLTHNSEIVSRRFPGWHLGHNPTHEIIACSYAVDLVNAEFSRPARAMLRDKRFQVLFPECKLDPDFQGVEGWRTTKGGGYSAAGVGGPITGKGAHILLIDDPIKNAQDADSETIRETLWAWYGSTAYTRLAPGGGVLVIQTWWHDDDLAGRIQEAMLADAEYPRFELVRYPAIAEHDEYQCSETQKIVRIDPASDEVVYWPGEEEFEVRRSSLTLLRKKGGALHPERYDEKKLSLTRASLLPRHWSALYQQSPMPDDGIFFSKQMLKWVDIMPTKNVHRYQAWDFAITAKTSGDWTVGAMWVQDSNDDLYLHPELIRLRSGDGNSIVDTILDFYARYRPERLGFEDGQIWRALESQFKKRCLEKRLYPAYELLRPVSDKEVRARPLQGRMQMGKVFLPNSMALKEVVEREFLRFPGGKHDDIVDACSWGVRLAMDAAPPRPLTPPKRKSWRDKLNASVDVSHMAA